MPKARTRDEVTNIMIECDCSEESARIIQGYRWDIEDLEERAKAEKAKLCTFYKQVLGETRAKVAA